MIDGAEAVVPAIWKLEVVNAYDASYLELSKRRGLPFATKDEPLRKAAATLGISIFQP